MRQAQKTMDPQPINDSTVNTPLGQFPIDGPVLVTTNKLSHGLSLQYRGKLIGYGGFKSNGKPHQRGDGGSPYSYGKYFFLHYNSANRIKQMAIPANQVKSILRE